MALWVLNTDSEKVVSVDECVRGLLGEEPTDDFQRELSSLIHSTAATLHYLYLRGLNDELTGEEMEAFVLRSS